MPSLTRAIAHIDADCFFASVELLSRPELRGKPVLVCNRTDNRGIVVSATYEARPSGIRAGTPVFKARTMCPEGIIIPTSFGKYESASSHLMQILRRFSPEVEASSIDEAYVDLTGLRLLYRSDYAGIGQRIQKTVLKEMGITVSIGIAETKILAKIASDFRKPAGLTVVAEKHREEFLRQITLKDIPGIGRNTLALLEKFSIRDALQFAHEHPKKIQHLLGKRGVELQMELSGTPVFKLQTHHAAPKSLSHTRTFAEFSSDRTFLHSFSLSILQKLLLRLRQHHCEAGLFAFFLMTKDFRMIGEKRKLEPHTDRDNDFIQIFEEIFQAIFEPDRVYRKSGFFLDNLTPKGTRQLSLFEEKNRKDIEPILDSFFLKYGKKGLTRGSFL